MERKRNRKKNVAAKQKNKLGENEGAEACDRGSTV
jgi:hypothetical protein